MLADLMGLGILAILTVAVIPLALAAEGDEGPPSIADWAPPQKLHFVENRGQFAADLQFGAAGESVAVGVGSNFLRLRLRSQTASADESSVHEVLIQWLGSNDSPLVQGQEVLPFRSSYFLGDDSARWTTDVPAFERVRIRDLYPGIDVVIYPHEDLLEFDYIVNPGADPKQIRWRLRNGVGPSADDGESPQAVLDADGDLMIPLGETHVRLRRPVAFQEGLHRDGRVPTRKPVDARFFSEDEHPAASDVWRISLGEYDTTRPLVIDPVFTYSTYYGGTQFDSAHALAVDTGGNTYLVGETWSVGLLLAQQVQSTRMAGKDVFILRMNPAFNGFTAASYFGGNGDDVPYAALAIGEDLVIAGETASTDLPGVSGRYQALNGGARDGFVTRIRLSASPAVLATTYIGGFGNDGVNALTRDLEGNIYAAGYTASSNFPLSTPSFGPAYQGGTNDAFVAKLSPMLTNALWSGIYGGSGSDNARAVTTGSGGTVWITGSTSSPNLPVAMPVQGVLLGAFDCFVAQISEDGQALLLSTYLGGISSEFCYAIQTDAAGNAVVAGSSASTDFPVTAGAFQAARAGSYDNVLFKVSAANGNLDFATYLGGSQTEAPTSLFADTAGNWCMAGYTLSPNFPLASAIQANFAGSFDGFLSCLNPTATGIVFSTYLGGNEEDRIHAATLGPGSRTVLTGMTHSLNFPITGDALQPASNGKGDAFLTVIDREAGNVAPANISVSPANGNTEVAHLTYTVEDRNGWSDIRFIYTLIHNVVSPVGGCYVRYDIDTNTMRLLSDSGTFWVDTATPGERKVLGNSQCKLDAEQSKVFAHATRIQLTLHFAFQPGFGGAKSLLMYTQDRAGVVAGWQLRGGWMVPALAGNVQPQVTYFAPNSGTFPGNAFVIQVTDENGANDINTVDFLVNSSLSYPSSCYVKYTRSLNRLQLLSDNSGAFLGNLTPGASGTIENSKCILSGAFSAASASGNVLTLVVHLTFKTLAAGSNSMWTLVSDQSSTFLGWRLQGAITVPLSASFSNPVAQAVSVLPLSHNTAQVSATGFDENGSQDIRDLYLLFNSTLSYAQGCFLLYRSPTQQVFLLNDAGTNWAGVGTLSGGQVLENGQCRVDLALAQETTTQDTKTIHYQVEFKPAFHGSRASHLYVEDEARLISGWRLLGTFTLPFP